jgi:four helix bundle protein
MDRERLANFEQMKVWQEAHGLVLRVLELTPTLPPEQQDGIAISMERTAIEIPKTIAEGFKRRGSRNKAHYYNLAQSHLEALRYYFILCRDLKYPFDYDDYAYRADQVARMLDSLVRSIARQTADPRGNPRGGRRGGGGGGRGRGGQPDRSAFPHDPDAPSFDPEGPESHAEGDLGDDDVDDIDDIGTGA